jgi:replication-associated recombination protein RarA
MGGRQMKLSELLKRHSTIGLVGNRSTAKTSLILDRLLELREEFPNVKIAGMGLNPELKPIMDKYNIQMLNSTMDILDLQMKDTILFIDEIALFFDSQTKSKQLTKLQRFFDRIEHQNCKLICGTAREGYFNKFMCSRLTAFLVKQIEYDALVNGTWLKERVKAIRSISDYRLVASKGEYYVVSAGDGMLTTRHSFEYNPELDTKKDNISLFDKNENKSGEKNDEKSEKKPIKYPIGVR